MAANSTRTVKRRGPGKPFAPGVSGNPSGRPKIVAEVRDLARRHAADAIAALVAIMQKGESDAARVSAANALLDRGYGKPTQVVDAEIGVRKLTDEQLTARIYELVKPKAIPALLAGEQDEECLPPSPLHPTRSADPAIGASPGGSHKD